ncbi:hypothetical protein ORI89_13285 [Sphingobacterium sp. UT-1RO-CII-1]|uniref:hypothetical protein n=1 Tax=Sphingobacterium sp. UT-1RO-CII-1 TaxID=2995225 RepID=UPI00227A3453|nr:hypothetical protein [Sphingobacterium sp. UT-1RO-CII-1]MCY4780627.1 hypothetical protein [Sphingobacterium sp. UT-1RO-CII-1]
MIRKKIVDRCIYIGTSVVIVCAIVACSSVSSKSVSEEEKQYYIEVIKRRDQGRILINNGYSNSKNMSCRKVYEALIRYYDLTEPVFASLSEKYASSESSELEDAAEWPLTDVETITLLQHHVLGTITLYRSSVLKDVNEEYQNQFLLLIPALMAQSDDLSALQEIIEDVNLSLEHR